MSDVLSLSEHLVSVISRLLLGPKLVQDLLFDGRVKPEYRSKDTYKEVTSRYKDSISDVNRTIGFGITFTIIALYVYFVLPATDTVEIPVVEVSVSRGIWISIAPAISFGLEILVITSFLWFMTLRVGLKLLVEESKLDISPQEKAVGESTQQADSDGQNDRVALADLTNILLKGILGELWMIFRIRNVFQSRFHYVWYVPTLLLVVAMISSPMILSFIFTIQLFIANNLLLGITYIVMLVPMSILLLLLIRMVGLLGITEGFW